MKKLLSLVNVVVILALLLLVLPSTAAAQPSQTAAGPGCAQFYQVQRGDTLFSIARRFGTTVPALAALNGIANPNRIYVGQWLCVKAAPPQPSGFWYTVKWGDTLSSIAARFGWTTWYLASVNGLSNPNFIYAGQKLWIPNH